MIPVLLACTDKGPPPVDLEPQDTQATGLGETGQTDAGLTDTGQPEPPREPLLQFVGEPPPNLVFISLDTTRRDYVGRYGGTGNTPNLDRVLSEGVVLDDHRTCSNWTGPSMSCVTTGNTPFEQGWWPWSDDPEIPGSWEELPTLASQLEAQGWITVVVTGNEVFGWDLYLNRGFLEFVNPEFEPADVVAEAAVDEADGLVDQLLPYYLHVHFIDPHGTYCPPEEYIDEDYVDLGVPICPHAEGLVATVYPDQPPEWQEQFEADLRELYEAELQFWDAEFGRFWDELEGMGVLDDALVVFATDHGEQLLDRGELGHGLALGSEENRAVAGFWAKNLPAKVWSEPTVHQDIAASLQALYGITPPLPSSGMPVGTAPVDRVIRSMNFWAESGPELSVVQGGTQLLYDWNGRRALYRISEEPAGLVDQYDPADPEVVALWESMMPFVDEISATWDHLAPPVAPGP
jgi:hypothetical protein